jgi:hypothetical protein
MAVDDTWGFESMSPAQLYGVDHRWTRESIKKGDKVKVRYSPIKDGRHGGSMNSVTLPTARCISVRRMPASGAKDNPKSPGRSGLAIAPIGWELRIIRISNRQPQRLSLISPLHIHPERGMTAILSGPGSRWCW